MRIMHCIKWLENFEYKFEHTNLNMKAVKTFLLKSVQVFDSKRDLDTKKFETLVQREYLGAFA